jgi:hypothetical protein
MRRQVVATLGIGALSLAWLPAVLGDVPPAPDTIFARAKAAWRERAEMPFVSYGLRERYEWRGRVHDNWWQVQYRTADRALALQRIIVASQEDARLRGVPITLNFRLHDNPARADSVDTNPDADAFPILDPEIDPNASFGMLGHERRSSLVGVATASPDAAATALPSAAPAIAAAPTPEPGQTPLRELIRVEAVARDYRIELAGTERIRDADTYHLMLTPLRDPRVYRLRDLWVDTQSYVTVQLALAGLFDGKPYADARWIVSYVPIDGRYYVGQIKTDDQLRFGADRFVSGLQFDFVQYAFPASIPPLVFERFL